MTTRVLPPEDWPLLEGTELETVYPHMDPHRSLVIVVEDGARIVACWALLQMLHVEGVWIDPEYRKNGSSPAGRLLAEMKRIARETGAKTVYTSALTKDVAGLIAHIGGTELPGRHFVIGVTE